MYPGTIVEYVDQSYIQPITMETLTNRPLLFALFTSDRGPEDLTRVYGKDFFKLYGEKISYEKHGQPLLQAAMSVNWGAELLCKRVVASDSKLANNAIYVKVSANTETPNVAKLSYFSMSSDTSVSDPEALMEKCKMLCREKFLDGDNAKYKAVRGATVYSDGEYTTIASPLAGVIGENGELIADEKELTYTTITATTHAWSFKENYHVDADTSYYSTPECADPFSGETTDASTPVTIVYEDGGTHYTISIEGTTYYVKEAAVLYDNYFVKEFIGNELNPYIEDNSTDHYYPIIAVTDNGRGVSTKSYSIYMNDKISKNSTYIMYDIEVKEGSNSLETIHFSFNPDATSGTTSISLNESTRSATQFKAYQDPTEYKNFYNTIKSITGQSDGELGNVDIIFGMTRKNIELGYIKLANKEDDPLVVFPSEDHVLANGSNGSFGNKPVISDSYASEMCKVFTETTAEPGPDPSKYVEKYAELWDLDRNMPIAVVDANYPMNLKDAISSWANDRQDLVFLRDMGNGTLKDSSGLTIKLDTFTAIKTAEEAINAEYKTQFNALYHNYYDIIDPYSYKQITVTIGYSLARLLIQQFGNGLSLPFVGMKYGITIPEAIPGTVNFLPVITPNAGNQKEQLDDIRVNYASYYGDLLVVETEYTLYQKYSQFSYINNIFAIQEAVRAVRRRCPVIRYSFISGSDFDAYKSDVNNVLSNYSSNFLSLELEYLGDATYVANKIFYAAIKARFRDFVQTEWFKVIALSNTD